MSNKMSWGVIVAIIIGIIIVIAIICVIIYFAIQTPTPLNHKGNGCVSKEDCVVDQICDGGICKSLSCVGDSDCPTGKKCGKGRCLSLSCNSNTPGPSQVTCPDPNLSCNLQYSVCVPNTCASDDVCPNGMHCSNGKCTPKVFNPLCNDGSCGCKQPSDCTNIGESCITNLCVPWGCKTDSECSNGKVCSVGSCIDPNICPHPTVSINGSGMNSGSCGVSMNTNECNLGGNDPSKGHWVIIKNNTAGVLYIGAYGLLLNPVTQGLIYPGDVKRSEYIPTVNGNVGGWALNAGDTNYILLPVVYQGMNVGWQGRFWARTGCTFDANGNGHCITGDCGGTLACNGKTGNPPATLIEANFNANPNNTFKQPIDFYDVSLVDGFNVAAEVVPIASTINPNDSGDKYWCGQIGCSTNLNSCCPVDLQVKDTDNVVVLGCLTACSKFGDAQHCCSMSSIYGAPISCIPSQWDVNYPSFYKRGCGDLYSFPYDDVTSTYKCASASPPSVYSAYCISFG